MSDETLREIARNGETDCANGETWLSPQEAAARLGITVRAVQIRAQRGQIKSRRDERRLYVCLEETPDSGETSETPARNDGEALRETAQTDETEDFALRETASSLLQEHMTEEITFLRVRVENSEQEREQERNRHTQEIQRRDVAEGELRRLLLADRQEIAQLRQQLALAAAPDPVVETDMTPAVESAPAATVRDTVQDAPRASEPRRWWEFWKGREE